MIFLPRYYYTNHPYSPFHETFMPHHSPCIIETFLLKGTNLASTANAYTFHFPYQMMSRRFSSHFHKTFLLFSPSHFLIIFSSIVQLYGRICCFTKAKHTFLLIICIGTQIHNYSSVFLLLFLGCIPSLPTSPGIHQICISSQTTQKTHLILTSCWITQS